MNTTFLVHPLGPHDPSIINVPAFKTTHRCHLASSLPNLLSLVYIYSMPTPTPTPMAVSFLGGVLL